MDRDLPPGNLFHAFSVQTWSLPLPVLTSLRCLQLFADEEFVCFQIPRGRGGGDFGR
jgi:hypothetical protein